MKIEREGVNGKVDPELTKKIVSLVDSVIKLDKQNTSEEIGKPLEILIIDKPPFMYKRFYIVSKINNVISSAYGHYQVNTASGQITNVGINYAIQNQTTRGINGISQNEAALEDAKKLLTISGINLIK